MSDEKQVALVTGGNRGIGYELVKQLASSGFKVILTSRSSEKGNKVTGELRELNMDVSFVLMDVDDPKSIEQAAAKVYEQHGRIDVLINNAGVYLDEHNHLLDMDPSVIQKTMKINFFGPFYVMRSFIPLMEKRGYGRVINISSEYGEMRALTSSGVGAYKLSKFSLNGLTQLIAAEVQGDIKINAADPGWVSTDMGGPSAPRTPEETAKSILWLATIGSEGPNGKLFRDKKQIDW
ncbi:short-chain dehydrogenase [Bacillus sp. Root147]|nr:short-chain dehydrogenase [Bacillus sp. Root147]